MQFYRNHFTPPHNKPNNAKTFQNKNKPPAANQFLRGPINVQPKPTNQCFTTNFQVFGKNTPN